MAPDPSDIRGWQRLSTTQTTSGRLEAKDIARLKGIGVRHVINLALDDHPEALEGEAALLAGAGLAYTHIPVPFDAPTSAHFDAFVTALDSIDGPVHVHCIMNWRVSAFFYRLNRQGGMSERAASALMEAQWDPRRSNDPRAKIWANFIS